MEVLPDSLLIGGGMDISLTLGAVLQALAEQLSGEIDICNDLSTNDQVISYFNWAKENAMQMATQLAKLEAQSNMDPPSLTQIECWEKEAVQTSLRNFAPTSYKLRQVRKPWKNSSCLLMEMPSPQRPTATWCGLGLMLFTQTWQ